MNTQHFSLQSHEQFMKKTSSNENINKSFSCIDSGSRMKKSSSMENISKTQVITQHQSFNNKTMRKNKSCETDFNLEKTNVAPKPMRKTKSYEENIHLNTEKESQEDVNYYNESIDYKKAVYETIKSQAPGLLLDIAKESQNIENFNQLKDSLGDMVSHHVTDTLVTSTISHLIHKL
jgi:hypothetical protein